MVWGFHAKEKDMLQVCGLLNEYQWLQGNKTHSWLKSQPVAEQHKPGLDIDFSWWVTTYAHSLTKAARHARLAVRWQKGKDRELKIKKKKNLQNQNVTN